MKHFKLMARKPELAQSELCTDIVGDSQATKCFVTEVLVNFALPVIQAKNDLDDRGAGSTPL